MFNETIEEEANEREIRRIRRARLTATSNKHKGDVMERREWRVGSRSSRDATIYEGGRWIAQVGIDYADIIVNDHNQHTTLVEQRDLLASALRPFAALDIDAFDHLRDKPDHWNVYQMNETIVTLGDVRRARTALATVEQGHERQAGGGSEG